MSTNPNDEELGVCCADFYNHPLVVKLLDGIFHPGGLALSRLMVQRMDLPDDSTILDIACGDGKTAAFLAKSLGHRVYGIDANQVMIEAATKAAQALGIDDRTDFRVALASKIPYEDRTFTAAISECSLCTFYDKEIAVSEMNRVLNSKGTIGLNDVTVRDHDELDEELRGLLGRLACIADAFSNEGYINLFQRHDYLLTWSSNHSNLLRDLAEKAKGRARVLRDLEGNRETSQKMTDAIQIIEKIERQIASDNIGYEMFIFKSRQ